MMKKLIVLMIALLVMCSVAFAANGNIGAGVGIAMGAASNSKAPVNKIQLNSSVQGLKNAMIQVKNQSRAEHIEKVMNRIQERHRERLNRLEDLTFTENEDAKDCEGNCSIMATGRGPAKFLWLFQKERKYQYEIQPDGEIKQQKRWYDYLWKFED